jgi:putative ABC transport system substrate-binding protein
LGEPGAFRGHPKAQASHLVKRLPELRFSVDLKLAGSCPMTNSFSYRQRILRLAALFTLAFAVAVGTAPAIAQSNTAPLKRIGYLTRWGCPLPTDSPIRHRLAELDWIEGRNLAFECVSAEGRLDQVPALAAELVSRRPDVLMADANPMIRALKRATATIPIIMLLAQDPVRTELVTNLARPEANVTGVAWFGYDLLPKRIELFKEIVPKLERLAIIVYAFADPKTVESLQNNITTATKTFGFTWQLFRPEAAEDYDKIFARLSVEHFDAATLMLHMSTRTH